MFCYRMQLTLIRSCVVFYSKRHCHNSLIPCLFIYIKELFILEFTWLYKYIFYAVIHTMYIDHVLWKASFLAGIKFKQLLFLLYVFILLGDFLMEIFCGILKTVCSRNLKRLIYSLTLWYNWSFHNCKY